MNTHDNAPDNTVTLKFDAQALREQLDHTKAAPLHKLTMSDRAELYGKDNMSHQQPDEETNGKPGLWLVKDSGIYLMSNGNPGLPDTETNHNPDSLLKVAYAKGYGPLADYDTIRQAVGGDDFTEGTLNVEWFEAALQLAEQHQRDEIFITMTDTDIRLSY